jgi:hypothetical protein
VSTDLAEVEAPDTVDYPDFRPCPKCGNWQPAELVHADTCETYCLPDDIESHLEAVYDPDGPHRVALAHGTCDGCRQEAPDCTCPRCGHCGSRLAGTGRGDDPYDCPNC